MFDPNKHKPQQFDNSALPAGRYLLVLEHLERKTGKESGKPYIRGRYRVIAGPLKNRTFFSSISIDLTKDGTAGRLSAFCAAANAKDRVNLDDDASLSRAWLNRPFKAEISQKQNGGYVNNDIRLYCIEAKDVGAQDKRAMEEWRAQFLEKQKMDDAGAFSDDGFPGDDDAPDSNGQDEDDDIPF